MSTAQFDDIYLNQSRYAGSVRIADSGLGWKAILPSGVSPDQFPQSLTEPFLLPSSEILAATWSRAARGYECRLQTNNRGVVMLDGFEVEDLEELKSTLRQQLAVTLEVREHSVRGWNWGRMDFERNELVMQVAGKPAFEIPYSFVGNSNLVGKNEVAVEFNLENTVPGKRRATAGDEIVDMRFYIPGNTTVEDEEQDVEVADDMTAAEAFYETLKEKADISDANTQSIASFSEILFLTPRGRFDIEMFADAFRLRGKTYDYKVQYSAIQRMFLLPKPDDLHNLLIIHIDPPLRQGQTRYPFLVMQFLRDDELEIDLNLDDNELESKFKDRLKPHYDQAAYEVVAQVFRGLSDKRMLVPGAFRSLHGQPGLKCSLKASEGYLYPLEKSFLFVPKPTVYIPYGNIQFVTVSRVGTSSTSSRTFDLTITLISGPNHQFSNILRDELASLETFLTSKNIRVKNDLVDDQERLAAVLAEESDSDDEDYDRGSAADDDESVDEDFDADSSDGDVAEEYDENAPMSSSGSEDEDAQSEDDN
ncbi:hypothetical protein CANCADRAFT_18662, partial [Tortispora caseinolytica NRRL Y-17796]